MSVWSRASRTERRFENILSECLDSVDSPEGLEVCLQRYPAEAARLEPLLRSALQVRRSLAVPVREERRQQARQQFLHAAAQQAQAAPGYVRTRVPVRKQASLGHLRPLWRSFAPAITAAVLFVMALVPIMALTSNSALPGDWNYGFKRSTERVRLALAITPSDRLNLQLAFHQRRLYEIERLSADGHLDPSLLQSFSKETTALVDTVSTSPALGPSEALKVEQATQTQAKVLQQTVEPKASPAIKPDVAAVVTQSQQLQQQAAQVVEAKKVEATPHGTALAHSTTPAFTATDRSPAPSPTASTALAPSATGTAPVNATGTATATATATASPTGTTKPSPTATAKGLPIAASREQPILIPALPTPPPPPSVPSQAVGSSTPTLSAGTETGGALAIPNGPLQTPSETVPASSTNTVLNPPPSQTPVTTASPTASPTRIPPTATPSPTPLALPPQPPSSAAQSRVLLPAGQSTALTYHGPEMTIPRVLASIAGQYEAVYYTQPGYSTVVQSYYPGKSDPNITLEPGSELTIVMKPGVSGALTLSSPATPSPTPSPGP